jgi:pimeloyl-ACP methyl ester carboxylesterase
VRIVYLHGFASSPQSSKAQFFQGRFREKGIDVEIPALDAGDFEHLTITSQLEVVDRKIGSLPAILMGSSLGGYLAGLYAARHPGITEKLILMAPAFEFPRRWKARYTEAEVENWRRQGSVPVFHYGYKELKSLSYGLIEDSQLYENIPDFHQPCLIFHGEHDDVVPMDLSEKFAASHPNARLKRLSSGHELTDVLEEMWREVEAFIS